MRHWICCRNLCLKLQKGVQLPIWRASITTDRLQYRDLPCYGSHSELLLPTQLKRSPGFDLVHSFAHSTFISFSKYSKANSKIVPCIRRIVSAAVRVPHCFSGPRSYSTNSTSVCPPPTPSTQGQCLPCSPESDSHSDHIQIPDPPTNCCMSGCANCVWITYAQELAQLYKDSGRAAESVMNAIDDPSLKMFLNHELKEKLNSDD